MELKEGQNNCSTLR